MQATDILLDENDDLQFQDGDFKIGYSDQQHVEHIIKAFPGQYYQTPKIGVGIKKYLNASVSKQTVKRNIKENLELDNYRVNEVSIQGSIDEMNISIDAERMI